MDPQERTRAERQHQIGGRVFLWLMFLGLPLVLNRGYFDITETKTVFFVICTGLYLCFRLVMALQYGGVPAGIDASEGFILALFLLSLLSSGLSGFFRDSFLGPQGRWQGAGMLGLYALLFAAVRRRGWREEDVMAPLLAGQTLTAALAIVNHLGADPLGLMEKLMVSDRGRYISTLGNINFAGAYFTLTLGAATVWLLLAEDRGKRLRLALLTLPGLWAAMAARSESALLGLGAVLALLPLLLRAHPAALRRWPWLLPGIAVGMQLYALLCRAEGAYLSVLTRALLHPAMSLSLALTGALLGLALRKKEEAALRRFAKCYAAALAILLGLAALTLVLLNTRWRDLPLGSGEDWLRFSGAWGTDRGKIWARCIAYYKEYTPVQKLLGGGCGRLARLDSQQRLFPDAILDAAHCEYLQLLLNWGALGLLSWLGWLFVSLRSAFRRGEAVSLAMGAAALAYALQALVNIAQAPSICLFVLMLSLSASNGNKNRENEAFHH
ncbi:MAG: O-antigen ligase family protein [Oscillospiraceae bacterium]|nr:O-antigen ligase family protein [Oscillospiraceae bacterium]